MKRKVSTMETNMSAKAVMKKNMSSQKIKNMKESKEQIMREKSMMESITKEKEQRTSVFHCYLSTSTSEQERAKESLSMRETRAKYWRNSLLKNMVNDSPSS